MTILFLCDVDNIVTASGEHLDKSSLLPRAPLLTEIEKACFSQEKSIDQSQYMNIKHVNTGHPQLSPVNTKNDGALS